MITDSEAKERAIVAHWAPTFQHGHSDTFASEQLCAHGKHFPASTFELPSRELIHKVIMKLNDSSPGDDGLPLSAIKAVAGTAAVVLYGALIHMLDFRATLPGSRRA